MEFDSRADRLPFHDEDETVPAPDDTPTSSDTQIRHLQRVPLFSGFTEDELRRIVELSRIVEVAAGTVVTEMGEPGDSFFVIIDGTVTARTPIGTGSELRHDPGEHRPAPARRRSDAFLAAARRDARPHPAHPHDPVASRPPAGADCSRHSPGREPRLIDAHPAGAHFGRPQCRQRRANGLCRQSRRQGRWSNARKNISPQRGHAKFHFR
jgi:hypothetical protein